MRTKKLLLSSLIAASCMPVMSWAAAIEEVVVTAQKRAESINDVGLSISAATSDQLQALGALDVQVSNCGIRGWFGNPFFASRLLAATKQG
mgnify:CR=1 FL=1